MTDKLTPAGLGCLSAVVALWMSPFLCMLYGWYLKLMWGWFMILPPITWHQAVGLAILINFVKVKYVDNKDTDWTTIWKQMLTIQLSLPVAVLIGWVFWLCGFGNHAVAVEL